MTSTLPPEIISSLLSGHSAESYGVRTPHDLQRWIDDMHTDGKAATTIRVYVTDYIRRTGWQPPTPLRYPRVLREIQYVPTLTDLRKLASQPAPLSPTNNDPYMAGREMQFLVSSGVRVGELSKLTTSNITTYKDRYRIHIPAKITKTGEARITFSRYPLPHNAINVHSIGKRFAAARRRANLTTYRTDTGVRPTYAIHIHGLRSYFITTLSRRAQFGIGHILAGHRFYMDTYHAYTESELYEAHRKCDSYLDLQVPVFTTELK